MNVSLHKIETESRIQINIVLIFKIDLYILLYVIRSRLRFHSCIYVIFPFLAHGNTHALLYFLLFHTRCRITILLLLYMYTGAQIIKNRWQLVKFRFLGVLNLRYWKKNAISKQGTRIPRRHL